MKSKLTIARLAEAAEVGVETVRFYQRSGLLAEPDKPATGYREYSHADVQRIRFIKRAQTLGFNLDNIAELLELDGPQICDVTHDLALNKLHLVEEKIAALQSIRDALQGMVRRCEAKHERGVCPIIQSLAKDEAKVSRKKAASSAAP